MNQPAAASRQRPAIVRQQRSTDNRLPARRASVPRYLHASRALARRTGQFALLLGATILAACELDEIVVDEGDPVTVVHAVMRPDLPQQWILVETSLTGSVEELDETGFVPGGVGRPVLRAVVTVANVTFSDDPCGPQVTFDADPADPRHQTAGVYWSPSGCPTMRPGDTLELRVDTPGGSTVTGSTEVPGILGATLRAGGREAGLPGPPFLFNRDTDTLIAEVDAVRGRALQIEITEQLEPFGPRSGTSQFFVDSAAVSLPGTIPNIFDNDFDLDDYVPALFAAGSAYDLTTAWTDRNYFDFVRSLNSPLSGRGFINNLTGGMGVFGSLVAVTSELRVTGTMNEPEEGFYRFTGTVAGVPVDIVWEVYIRTPEQQARYPFGGFVAGQWVFGDLDDNTFGFPTGGDGFLIYVSQSDPASDVESPQPFVLTGRFRSGSSFPVEVDVGSDEYSIQGIRIEGPQ